MKQTRILMGMPIAVEIVDANADNLIFSKIFDYFTYIDNTFSTYKKTSEISKINKGQIKTSDFNKDIVEVLELSEKTKKETNGYFDVYKDGYLDPSGLVKGWAIHNAVNIVKKSGFKNFYIDAGGDIEALGKNSTGKKWKVGIRNPFNIKEIVKVLSVSGVGVATSGTYERGEHIYNPHSNFSQAKSISSMTVVSSNVYEADRFATAAFAMGERGIQFIELLKGFEGYMIDNKGIATQTSGFNKFVV